MNYFSILACLLLMGACTKENQSADEDLKAIKSKGLASEEHQEVFELDMHQYYILEELDGLYEQKSKLETEIEEGNEDQITVWESVMERIHRSTDALHSIIESSCSYLRMREEILQIQVIRGNEPAKAELEEVRKKLKKCDNEIELDLALETQTIILAIEKGGIGGRCIPGNDWTCYDEFERGVLKVNIVESQDEQPEIILRDSSGKIIGQGEMIGEHNELEQVTQIAINLQSIEDGILEFVSENKSYQQVITVH